MNITDEVLMAYADDELEAATRAEVEAAIARDPTLAARVQEHRALREQLQGAFAPVLDEPVPGRLLDAAQVFPATGKSTIVDLAQARQQRTGVTPARWSLPQWSAIAASMLVGLLVGYNVINSRATVQMRNGELVASGSLAAALNEQLSSEEGGNTHIALSFRTHDGTYCRTFNSTGKQAIAGVACHKDAAWKVRALTELQNDGTDYRMAGSSLPTAIRAVVEESMQGEALSVEEEGAARTKQWH